MSARALRGRVTPEIAVFAALALLWFAAIMWFGRGTQPFYDEWDIITRRRDWDLDTMLEPGNGHLSVVLFLIYKVLLSIVGLGDHWVFRAVLGLLHVFTAAVVFRFAAIRAGQLIGLVAGALILCIGISGDNMLWPVQIGYLLSLAFGTIALMSLASTRRRSGTVAAAALLISLGSSGFGAIFLGAAVVHALWTRWRTDLIAVGIPVVLYGLWYVLYAGTGSGRAETELANASQLATYAVDMASAGFGGLFGFDVTVGRVLLVLAIIALAREVLGGLRITATAAALTAGAVALWLLIAVSRLNLGEPAAPRYVYPSAIFIVLLGAELLRGRRIPVRAPWVGGAVVAFVLVIGLGHLKANGDRLQANAATLEAQLAAAALTPATVAGDFQPAPNIDPQIVTGLLDEAEADYGPLVSDPQRELQGAFNVDRVSADETLVRSGAIAIDTGRRTLTGSCRVTPAGTPTDLTVPPGGTVELQSREPAELRARLFGDSYSDRYPTPLPGDEAIAITPLPTTVNRPWHIEIRHTASLRVCTG